MEAFFNDRPEARALFDALRARLDAIGPTEITATQSRVAFVRRTRFLWVHEAGLHHLWIGFKLARPLDTQRCRSAARGDTWFHHCKITRVADLDDGLMGWLREAYDADGPA